MGTNRPDIRWLGATAELNLKRTKLQAFAVQLKIRRAGSPNLALVGLEALQDVRAR